MAEGALSGLKVLELGHYIAGPYCGCLLAGCGAEVIKVERPGEGDPARRAGPFFQNEPGIERSALFLYLNTRKKGITLNLKTQAGAEILKKLVKDADVLVENFEPRVMPGLGLGWDTLKEINPRLVMVSISNFGQTGPYRDFKGTNMTTLAMGGQMSLTGEPDREPVKSGGSQAEYQGGLAGYTAAVIGSFGAVMHGTGQQVDISIQEVMASGLEGSLPYTSYLGPMHNRHRGGLRFRATLGIYPCADGYVGVHSNAREWAKLVEELDNPELVNDPRFDTIDKRLANNDELQLEIMNWTVEHTKAEVYEKATRLRTCWAPVLNTGELFESPQYKERKYFVEIDHPETGPLMYPGAPFRMSETPWQVGRAPLLGEHNEEIFCGRLGYTKDDLVRLKGQGII